MTKDPSESVRQFEAALPQIKTSLPATGEAAKLSFPDLDTVLELAKQSLHLKPIKPMTGGRNSD